MPNKLSEKPNLAEYQAYIAALVEERDWEKNPEAVFVRFTEEVGELAKEMRKRRKLGEAQPNAAGEVADVFFYLCDLANHLGVDITAAIDEKLKENETRTWEY
jgi:NTP pyrophosphatase (non-canonical NTP hydrolase)